MRASTVGLARVVTRSRALAIDARSSARAVGAAPSRARARVEGAARGRATATKGRMTTTTTRASEDGAHDARVVTYNVLSSHLAEPTYFTHCDANDLRAETRLRRVIEKLEPEVERRAVVGLQEVSMTWAGPLHAYFAKRGYAFIVSLYGKPFNNYMGVGLAVPTDAYEVVKSDIARLSDTAKFPRAKKEEVNLGPLTPVYNLLVQTPVNLWRKLRDMATVEL